MLNLTSAELFKSLLGFEINGVMVDLHNDYSCEEMTYDASQCSLMCCFKGGDVVIVRFEDAIISVFNFSFSRTLESSTLNNFYRGRFEMDGSLHEYTNDGKGYYYLEFEAGDMVELYARSVYLYKK